MVNDLMYCSPYTVDSCRIATLIQSQIVTAVTVAFNTVWFGSMEGQLWKCPINKLHEMSIDKKCRKFDKLNPSYPVNKIIASNKYLYVHLKDELKIWRCDPENLKSCDILMTVSNRFIGPYMFIET